MAQQFTVDHARLDRYRRAADAARGESSSASERVKEARHQVRDAQDEVERLEHSHGGGQYLPTAHARLKATQEEVSRLARVQSDGAAARQHATTLFARLEDYVGRAAR